MILKPNYDDVKIIGYYLGKVIIALGVTMFLPMVTAVIFKEQGPILDFFISSSLCFILGFSFLTIFYTDKDLVTMHAMIIASLSWLVAMFLGALPLYLSGHWGSFLDACFDAMSGFATTGLTLAVDLDHISMTHNMWRHLIMFIGGQGIVVVALTFLVRGSGGAFMMYVGEARDERVLPNVVHTARFIWFISIIYLIIGTVALAAVAVFEGMPLIRSIFHGMWIFMAAFDTGGFTPQSQSILYYHSLPFEVVTVVIMLLGAINFKLHYVILNGNKKEFFRNIEIRTLILTIFITLLLTIVGLAKLGVYQDSLGLFRKGFYQLISGHTGTGYQTIYARQFLLEWGNLALVAVIIAMAIGGSACSTTGAIKTLRIGLMFKALREDIKKVMLPSQAVIIQKFHHIKDFVLNNKQIRSALLITLCYLGIYTLGAIIGTIFGYSFLESLFESTSAAANVGLSCGVTTPTMPNVLKVTYILQMWIGRLEFMSAFALIGFIIAAVKGK